LASRRAAPLAAALAALLGGCRSYPYAKKTPDELFADAGVDIREGNGTAATTKLDYLKTKFPDFPDKQGVEFRSAEAMRVSGKLWPAFVEFRKFEERYRVTSLYYSQLQDNIYAIGTQLIQSRSSVLGLGIFRDADDGVVVLQFYVDKFATSTRADEALRQIAEYKYEVGDYAGSIAAYEKILKGYTSSAWRDQAEYRIGIAHMRSVRRADQDQNELLKAQDQLTTYLATRVEGARREDAKIALRECEDLLAKSEYMIGEFYRVIDQPFGAALHYEIAITKYPAAKYSVEAERRLDELERSKKGRPASKPESASASGP
jgi:outer membrane protein assembly factor BamD (BamD/ComL family)